MLSIKVENKTVTPMPSKEGLFSDVTVPNSSATHCSLIRSAQALGINYPTMTELEIDSAVESCLLDISNWLETIEVSDEEVKSELDSIRGYTDEELSKYLEENEVSNEEAVLFLINKDFNQEAVVVPSNQDIELSLLEAKELSAAKFKVSALIDAGMLVTDLDEINDDADLIHQSFLDIMGTPVEF